MATTKTRKKHNGDEPKIVVKNRNSTMPKSYYDAQKNPSKYRGKKV